MRPLPLLAASMFSLLAASGALAADVVEPAPMPVEVAEVPIFTWTGVYIGIQGGYAWSEAETLGLSEDFNGGMLGGYAGYNWQTGNFVIGAEGDISAVWNDETFDVLGEDVEVGSDYLASIRGRVGYVWDRALIFGTAGVAFTEASADVTINGVNFDASENFTGWTVGAGVDYAFTDNVIGRVEYRYYDFGDQEIGDFLDDVDINFNTVTVGVAYKF